MITYEYDHWYLGGEWVKPAGTDTYAVVSPSNEQVRAHILVATNAETDRAVTAPGQVGRPVSGADRPRSTAPRSSRASQPWWRSVSTTSLSV